jgi:pilus assembly protein CpaB
MMAAGLSLVGLSAIVGYKSLRHQSVAGASAAPAAAALALASAARDIKVGETIEAAQLRTVAGDAAHNPGIATPGEAIGKVTLRPIPAGALIDRSMLDAQTRLAVRVPVGMRAMSIDTSAEIAVAGLIRPGDSVDVQAVYPGEDAINGMRGTGRSHARTLLQMVPVLAVGELVLGSNAARNNNATSDSAITSAARTVTLALTPEQVSALSLARRVGTLSLSLRNPDDKDVGAVPATAIADAAPDAPRPARALPRPARRPLRPAADPAVQIVVGGHADLTQ